MLFALLALFIVGPIAEIYVLLIAGNAFGAVPVIAACLLTAFLGGFIIRLQGLAALNNARGDLQTGRLPVDSAVDGALLVVAAPLLMTPGFITDLIGFALLTPPLRRALARYALSRIRASIVYREERRQ
ncbi:FxsA family protein [Hyphococcus flavus]|uniref:FxsA family protein n=1 Tax=Hyphococcus flavus TaxID=1866326 RepID=A0AAF0CFU0_9PROT|nr:FxsA family protein [Hyphococcus flavus]WDI32801.1 FxsA family protein [Hyphococcus flavus]